jgi:hypothetical protein
MAAYAACVRIMIAGLTARLWRPGFFALFPQARLRFVLA